LLYTVKKLLYLIDLYVKKKSSELSQANLFESRDLGVDDFMYDLKAIDVSVGIGLLYSYFNVNESKGLYYGDFKKIVLDWLISEEVLSKYEAKQF
jgi:hypothetical protein